MPGWSYALLGWVGGVGSTVAGSWISSKIHTYHESRRAHLDDLRDHVLVPLRAGLSEHLKPLVFEQSPAVVLVDSARQFKEQASATDEPTTLAHLLAQAFVFGHVFKEIEPALLDDARAHHFPDLVAMLDSFNRDWSDWARDCHQWISEIAGSIPGPTGLPPFNPNGSGPYVMNARLALFVYRRTFHFETGALRKASIANQMTPWTLTSGSVTLALGNTEQQIDQVIQVVDALLGAEKKRAEALKKRSATLRSQFEDFSVKLDVAVASRKLHHRCDLVSFF